MSLSSAHCPRVSSDRLLRLYSAASERSAPLAALEVQHPLTYGFFTTLSLGTPFPKNFRQTCQTVLRRLFRIYGHIYASHFDQICALGIEGASRFFRPMFNAISPTPS